MEDRPEQPTETSDGSNPAAEPTIPDPGIPGYHILGRLGAGGMGVVLLAEQTEPVRRRVALKLLARGLDSRALLARFAQERQALALMSHPNIAQVYDAGTAADGRPYFAMEYVDGEPITAHCDARRMALDARLVLFRQLCDGVQHAHQRGILHRDLKPSNVLVASAHADGLVKVIDFGLARALDRDPTDASVETKVGQVIGTPAYMSPELAELGAAQVDTRTDVYSLGVLLYQLLSGRLPYESAGMKTTELVDLLRRIKEGEAPPPSAAVAADPARAAAAAERRGTDARGLARALRGDLDWIVGRAMAREAGRRYASASELAADVERHLSAQPVLAGPPSTAYRTGKFVRRHRLGVVSAALIAAALLVAVAASTIGLVRARRAESLAQAEAAKAKATTDFLLSVLGSPHPDRAGRDVRVVEALERATRAAGTSFAGQPLVEARVHGMLASSYRGLGIIDRAVREREAQVALLEGALGKDHPDTLDALTELCVLQFLKGPTEEAEPAIRAALGHTARALGEEHRLTLRQKQLLAGVLVDRGDYAGAEALLRPVIEAWGRNPNAGPTDILVAQGHLAVALLRQERFDEAVALDRVVLEAIVRNEGPSSLEALNYRTTLASALGSAGRLEEAGAVFAENLELQRIALGLDHPDTLLTLYNLGVFRFMTGDLPASETLFREGLERSERLRPTGHVDTERLRSSLGQVMTALGRCCEAIPLLETAEKRLRERQGEKNFDTIDAANGLGQARAACATADGARRD